MTDSAGAQVWGVIYRPFGEVNNISENPATMDLRFPGQWFQLQNGLAYNWHRHYDASLGRYVSADPLGLTAMLSDGPANYNYAGQRPGVFADEMGLQRLPQRVRTWLEYTQQFPSHSAITQGNAPSGTRFQPVMTSPGSVPASFGVQGINQCFGGVYGMYRNGELIYVGRTIDFVRRQSEHGRDPRFEGADF